MNKISIIGSDSFIATQFYNSINKKDCVEKLYAIKSSEKAKEVVGDLFGITEKDLYTSKVILNFAAIVHKPKLKDDNLYKKVNTDLPIYLAKEAKKAGVEHFIQMSTIAVYGGVSSISVKNTENPQNTYGLSKLNADKELLKMQDDNFKVTIVRPPMVYGGGRAPGNLLKLINTAQKGIPMPFKNIKNKRDFLHVHNLTEALKTIIENEIYGIVIPTDKKTISSEEILAYIQEYSPQKIRVFKIPSFAKQLIRLIKPNIYTKVFGNLIVECNLAGSVYKPQKSIEQGIEEMIKNI